MRKLLFSVMVTLGGLYLIVHLILGSSPVQKRVLREIRTALTQFGLDLKIESIEFSAFTPKIYLNRVTLTAMPGARVSFPEPIAIDKIKLEFDPLALIYHQISFEEVTLFHPRLILPHADRLYRQIMHLLTEKKKIEVRSSRYSLLVKRIGVVDALFNVASQNPEFTVRSRSFSAFLQNNIRGQQNVNVESTNLDIERGPLHLELTRAEWDVDITNKSVRVNRGILEADRMAVDLKTTFSLPLREGREPDSLAASFDIHLPLELLSRVPELKLPKLVGHLNTTGTFSLSSGVPSGHGKVEYDELKISDVPLGSGELDFRMLDRKLDVSGLTLKIAGGEVKSPGIRVEMVDRFGVSGTVDLRQIRLEKILAMANQADVPIQMDENGTIKFDGFLKGPFEVNGETKIDFDQFAVVKDETREASPANTVLAVKHGAVDANFKCTEDKIGYQATIRLLNGKIGAEGMVGFNQTAKIHAQGEGLSLTELNHIGGVRMGGTTNVSADIEVRGNDARVAGSYEITDAIINDVQLGNVEGEGYFRDAMLAFENIEIPSTEPIHGNGFVDFRPKLNHFHFEADARRASVNQVFDSLARLKLGFGIPQGGELGARLTIDGNNDDIEIRTSGTAKNFSWRGESWVSANYDLVYRPDAIQLERLVLLKKSGGLEIRGTFADRASKLHLLSHDLRLEEFDIIGKAPITGEFAGEALLQGDFSKGPVSGTGEIRLNKLTYRGSALPDSVFQLRTQNGEVEFTGNVIDQKLRLRYVTALNPPRTSSPSGTGPGTLTVNFQGFDFAPLAALWLGKDIPTITDITATGGLELRGSLSDLNSLSGSGSISDLYFGFRGTPMRNKQPLEIKIDEGSVKVPRFNLVGLDSQVALDLFYQPDVAIRASLDGKIDLQFLQPLIPGLEFGTGQVTAGLRVSGPPSNYELLGNISLEDTSFRFEGLNDEFRSTEAQFSVSQDRINVDHFETVLNGGRLGVEGDVKINRFHSLIPNLILNADRLTMKMMNTLSATFSGDLFLRGDSQPYLLGGHVRVANAELTKLEAGAARPLVAGELPLFKFDIKCEAPQHLFVNTDVAKAEFHGNFDVVGTTVRPAMLGTLEANTDNKNGQKGSIFFRNTRFDLDSGTVRFESAERLAPRFSISGSTLVREQVPAGNNGYPQQYQINLLVSGTPDDYKIRLSSTPVLQESDIISLLLLGVTSKTTAEGGGGIDFGAAIAGQVPLQQMLQKQLGLGITMGTQSTQSKTGAPTAQAPPTIGNSYYTTVPTVRIQKDITNQTKLSYSNTLESDPSRELKIEHILDEHFSVNGTVGVGNNQETTIETPSTTQSGNPTYGIDFRYRFEFE